MLLDFLLNEKHAIEYMQDDTSDKASGAVHLTEYQSSTPSNNNDQTTLLQLKTAVEELTKTLSNKSSITPRNNRRYNAKCWIHNSNTCEVTECITFNALPNQEKINAIKKHGSCYKCLKGGHLARNCSSTGNNCTILVDGNPCGKAHHHLLHFYHFYHFSSNKVESLAKHC